MGEKESVGMATAYFNRHSTYLDATMDFWTFLYDFYMAGISCQFMTLCVKLSAAKLGPPGTPDRPRSAQIGQIAQRRAQPLRSVFTLLFLLCTVLNKPLLLIILFPHHNLAILTGYGPT